MVEIKVVTANTIHGAIEQIEDPNLIYRIQKQIGNRWVIELKKVF
jgi:hypothetical protein